MRKTIRIVVIGDRLECWRTHHLARVGKTSIITTFISDRFPENVDPVLCEVVIPPDCTTNGASLTIVDSSCDHFVLESLVALEDDHEITCEQIRLV